MCAAVAVVEEQEERCQLGRHVSRLRRQARSVTYWAEQLASKHKGWCMRGVLRDHDLYMAVAHSACAGLIIDFVTEPSVATCLWGLVPRCVHSTSTKGDAHCGALLCRRDVTLSHKPSQFVHKPRHHILGEPVTALCHAPLPASASSRPSHSCYIPIPPGPSRMRMLQRGQSPGAFKEQCAHSSSHSALTSSKRLVAAESKLNSRMSPVLLSDTVPATSGCWSERHVTRVMCAYRLSWCLMWGPARGGGRVGRGTEHGTGMRWRTAGVE